MTKLESITKLVEYDHAILTVERAAELAEPFDITLAGLVSDTRRMVENGKPGGHVAADGPGVGAHQLAERIAKQYGFKPYCNGVGSRLRTACSYVRDHISP
jgi:hypothetical protein